MDKSLIETATRALTIEAVYLRDSTIRCNDRLLPPYPEAGLELVPQYRGMPGGKVDILSVAEEEGVQLGRMAVCHFQAGVRLVDDGQLAETMDAAEDSIRLEIGADFTAHYRIRDDVEDETLRPALEEFVRYNVGYHVWPYWREYVQNTCARMGIPPIPVPMYLLKDADHGRAPDSD